MHSTVIRVNHFGTGTHSDEEYDVVIHHNGDYSGEVLIVMPTETRTYGGRLEASVQTLHHPPHQEIRVPFSVLEELVGQKVLSEKTSKLERLSGREAIKEAINGT